MHLMQQDLITGGTALAIIILALLGIELLVKFKLIRQLGGRKLLHITAISSCAWAIGQFENRLLLAFIFLVFFFILLVLIQKRWLQVNEYRSYGIALFPLAFSCLLFIPALDQQLIAYAAWILGICDALAGIIGTYFGKKKIMFLYEQKSWTGFFTFFLAALLVTAIFFHDLSMNGIVLCLLLSLLPALTELFSYRGSDNFSVPVITALWAWLLLHMQASDWQMLLGMTVFFMLLACFAVYKKWLTVAGAAAACWMAMWLYSTGKELAFIAPGIFLICGSLLSKLNKPAHEKEGRSAIQVFANGIMGIVYMMLFGILHQPVFLLVALVSFTISMTDSVSSELGYFFKGATFDIGSFKKCAPGLSGGISIAGTLCGLAAAGLLATIAGYFYHLPIKIMLLITVGGFTGMVIDSVLGSLLQIKYLNKNGQLSDFSDSGAKMVKGLSWVNNDTVNLLSNILTSLIFYYIIARSV
jgi:uncharacterized protein (TIGR00297 family)